MKPDSPTQPTAGFSKGAWVALLPLTVIAGVVWRLAHTPGLWGWPELLCVGAMAVVIGLFILKDVRENRRIRRALAAALRGRPALTDEEFGRRFHEPALAPPGGTTTGCGTLQGRILQRAPPARPPRLPSGPSGRGNPTGFGSASPAQREGVRHETMQLEAAVAGAGRAGIRRRQPGTALRRSRPSALESSAAPGGGGAAVRERDRRGRVGRLAGGIARAEALLLERGAVHLSRWLETGPAVNDGCRLAGQQPDETRAGPAAGARVEG